MDRYDYQALVNEVVTRGINLFDSFDDWTKGAFALSCLGENGRGMFKGISKLSAKYDEAENDRKFTNAMHTSNKVGMASFIYMCRMRGIDTNRFYVKDGIGFTQPIATCVNRHQAGLPPVAIRYEYVTRSLDCNLHSDFTSYLKSLVADIGRISIVVNAYRLGVTRDGRVIFWNIDRDGVVRMGKAMAYGMDGHRDKSVAPLSIPKELSRRGELPADYVIKQTLFGEHLLCLPQNTDKTVGIVESEKSAIVCSLCIPDLLWMATGSKGNLQDERMRAVRDCKVILFPDTDSDGQAYRQWCRRAGELNADGWHVTVCDCLEKMVTPKQREAKIDIADLLIEDLVSRQNTYAETIVDMVLGMTSYSGEQVYVLSHSKLLLPIDGGQNTSRRSHFK